MQILELCAKGLKVENFHIGKTLLTQWKPMHHTTKLLLMCNMLKINWHPH
jgi:hypothetical protein